jgi:micrococcal nuclease
MTRWRKEEEPPLTSAHSAKEGNSRIIGWVMVDQGVWVNKVMVLTGYAWWFERYAPDEDQLREAQESARAAKRGLWAEPMAVAPWDWRKGVRRI